MTVVSHVDHPVTATLRRPGGAGLRAPAGDQGRAADPTALAGRARRASGVDDGDLRRAVVHAHASGADAASTRTGSSVRVAGRCRAAHVRQASGRSRLDDPSLVVRGREAAGYVGRAGGRRATRVSSGGWMPRSPISTLCGWLSPTARRRVLRRRFAVVPHPLRPGLAVGGPAALPVDHRIAAPPCGSSRASRARSTRGTAQQPGKILHELRGETLAMRARDRRCRRSTTAPSTPPRCGSACCRRVAGRDAGGTRCRDLLPSLARPWTGCAPRRRRRRRLPRLHRRDRPRPGQPGLEGLRRFGPSRTARSPTGRSRCARCRATRTRPHSPGPICWTLRSRRCRRLRDWAADAEARFRAAFWVATPGAATPRWPSTRTSGRSTPLTSNIGHLLGTGMLERRRSGRWPTG